MVLLLGPRRRRVSVLWKLRSRKHLSSSLTALLEMTSSHPFEKNAMTAPCKTSLKRLSTLTLSAQPELRECMP